MQIYSDTSIGLDGAGSSRTITPLGSETRSHSGAWDVRSHDTVKLSNASNLVSVARTAVSPDRAAKLAGLTAEVRSGSYQSSAADVSRAVVAEITR